MPSLQGRSDVIEEIYDGWILEIMGEYKPVSLGDISRQMKRKHSEVVEEGIRDALWRLVRKGRLEFAQGCTSLRRKT